MPIVDSDIDFRLSAPNASQGDSVPSSRGQSLGRYVSTTSMGSGLHVLFDKINGGEVHRGDVEYRCIFFVNNHATLTLNSAIIWVQYEITPGATVELAIDNIAATPKGSATPQASVTANESTAPTGVGPWSNAYNGLLLGNIPPGHVRAIWMCRTIGSLGAMKDGFRIAVAGDSA